MSKRLREQTIMVPNYGNDWINRLAAVLQVVEAMDEGERAAAFRFMKSRYSKEWPTDTYT